MQLLFLTPQLPYPPHQGTTIRNYYLIRHLAAQHTIDLFTFLAPGQQLTPDNPLYRYCRRIVTAPQPNRTLGQRGVDTLRSPLPDMALRLESQAMRTVVASAAQQEHYDAVQVEGIEMAQYGLQLATQAKERPLLVFDDHNCEYLLQQRNAFTDLRRPQRWLAALYSLLQWQKLRRYEAQICRQADLVLAVSEPDKAALQALGTTTPITVIANGIEVGDPGDGTTTTATPASTATAPLTLLFTGKMDYRPNIEGALWFGEKVLPLILAAEPRARFQIVGMHPHARLDPLRANPAVEITGAVSSIAPYLAAAAVYVVPLQVGGGTRFKVLEAMAAAKAIVSTTVGVEGIGLQDGGEILLADTPQAFAQSVLRLLRDQQAGSTLSTALGQRAHHFVTSHYSWREIIPRLEAALAQQPQSKHGLT